MTIVAKINLYLSDRQKSLQQNLQTPVFRWVRVNHCVYDKIDGYVFSAILRDAKGAQFMVKRGVPAQYIDESIVSVQRFQNVIDNAMRQLSRAVWDYSNDLVTPAERKQIEDIANQRLFGTDKKRDKGILEGFIDMEGF